MKTFGKLEKVQGDLIQKSSMIVVKNTIQKV